MRTTTTTTTRMLSTILFVLPLLVATAFQPALRCSRASTVLFEANGHGGMRISRETRDLEKSGRKGRSFEKYEAQDHQVKLDGRVMRENTKKDLVSSAEFARMNLNHASEAHSGEEGQLWLSGPTNNAPKGPSFLARLESSFRSLRSFILCGSMGLVLISPQNGPIPRSMVFAAADDTHVVIEGRSEPGKIDLLGGQDESQKQSVLTAPGSSDSTKRDVSIVEEVWTLVDKYYLDRSFNGQDWSKVKEKYLKQEKESNNDDKSMQLITSMTQSLGDKYSRILDKQAYEGIQKYDLIGVGVTLMPDSEKCIVVGAPPIAGSAAEKAGLKLNDYVLAINGISTTGRTAFDIIDQISENPTAKTVTMTIRSPPSPSDPPNEDSIRSVTMERSFAEVTNPVKYTLSETRSDGTKVGYIRIKEFNSLVKGKLEEALSDLEGKGANAYVLDIRHNPGGAFQSAVEISSLFLQDRVATYVVDSNKVELPFRIPSGRLLVNPEDPIAIWIDSGSASASEVLAGSLHDNCRAVVMGETSFGKGLVQAVYGLKNGAGLVLTVAKYITPDGTDIQGSGIKPDIPGHLPLALPPFLSSDTSQVDFRDVSKRLDACSVPPTHPEKSF